MKTRPVMLLLVMLICGVANVVAQIENQSGFILAIEGDEVFLDLTNENVNKGMKVSVYSPQKHFIHPVTKEKILREPSIIANLEITSVYENYSVAKVIETVNRVELVQGMKVSLCVKTDNKFELRSSEANSIANKAMPTSPNVISNGDPNDGKVAVFVAPAQVNDIVGIGYFGTYVSDLLMEQLMYCDKVRLLDRSIMGVQMSEIDLAGDYIDTKTAIKRGKIAGAKYVIQVTMQKPDVVNVKTGIPLASIMGAAQSIAGKNIGAQYMSNIEKGTLTASVSITARVVDLETGEVVFMCSGTGKAKGKSQLSMEYGALGGMELNGGADEFKQTVTGQAIQKSFITIGRNLNSYFNGTANGRVMGSASGFSAFNEKMEKRGRNIYIGTEKLSPDDAKSIFMDRSELYFKYKSARRNIPWSWAMICIGTPVALGGIIGVTSQLSSTSAGDDLGGYAVIGTIGIGLTTGGVIMNIKAHKNIKRVVNEYNMGIVPQKNGLNYSLDLVTPSTGGLGLKFTF